MKIIRLFSIVALIATTTLSAQNNAGFGTTTPNASAILEMQSTTQGVLVPRMTAVQRLAIPVNATTEGLLCYDLDSLCFFYYKAGVWTSLCNAGGVGPAGPTGVAGAAGTNGINGFSCWDLDLDGVNDPGEDVNSDGNWDGLDCQGIAGAAGPTGVAGPAGANGATGPSGDPGPTGLTGASGPSGDPGPTGAAGAMGPTGVAGASGPSGDPGPTGAVGAMGPTGPAGAVGAMGPTGPAGAVGAMGPTGPAGAVGAMGPTGVAGAVGPTGAAGAVGPTGPTAAVTSVSLAVDYTVTAAAWTNIAPMSVTFTATKTTALVIFSSSGFAYTNSMAFVQFRIRSGATTLGGTNTLTQNYDDVTGTITPWSCSFTKNITGLVIGNVYTYQVQAQRGGIFGTYDTAIYCATQPDSHHMTLSVIQ